MRDRLVVLSTIDRERRRVEALVDRLRRRFALGGLTVTDVQVKPHALVQLFLLGVQPQHRFKQVGRLRVRMLLQRLESALVNRDRFEIRRPPLRRGRRWRSGRALS